jgi:hypothetical protein
VFDEGLPHGRTRAIVANVVLHACDELGMPEAGHKMFRLRIPVWPVLFAHRLRQQRPNGNLDAFDRIHHGQAQLAVKNVEVEHILKGCALKEAVSAVCVVVHLERQRVAGQSVITNESQVVSGNLVVGDHQPTLLE